MITKKKYLADVQKKYGVYSVNEFTKKCYECALKHTDFFFEVLTGVVEVYYTEQEENLSRG